MCHGLLDEYLLGLADVISQEQLHVGIFNYTSFVLAVAIGRKQTILQSRHILLLNNIYFISAVICRQIFLSHQPAPK